MQILSMVNSSGLPRALKRLNDADKVAIRMVLGYLVYAMGKVHAEAKAGGRKGC
jgi:hypothetical protein